MISDPLLQKLVCPRDRMPLKNESGGLVCPDGHEYPVVEGIPVLLLDEEVQTIGIASASLAAAAAFSKGVMTDDKWFTSTLGITDEERQCLIVEANRGKSKCDPVVKFMIGATNGILYRQLIGRIDEYTIPDLRLPPGKGQCLLDIGCNWGRWSVAAAKLGYRPVGLDPSLGAVLAGARVCRQLGLTADFVVGDARFLPFADGCFDVAMSYSVIQHFSKENAKIAVSEIGRILKGKGRGMVQMPNTFGLRCLYHQFKRGLRRPTQFEVRYWTVPELRRLFTSSIGPTSITVDCFFGIGVQRSDRHLMPPARRALISASEYLRVGSGFCPPLKYIADSVYVNSEKLSK